MAELKKEMSIRGFNASASLKQLERADYSRMMIRVSEALMPRPH